MCVNFFLTLYLAVKITHCAERCRHERDGCEMQPNSKIFFLDVVRNGDCDELQKILESRDEKININLYDNEGQTALHQSCLIGSLKKVQILVKFGADIKLANRDGWNALHIASFGGHQDIALYLISTKSRTKTMSTSSDS